MSFVLHLSACCCFLSIFWTFSNHTLSCSSTFTLNLNKTFYKHCKGEMFVSLVNPVFCENKCDKQETWNYVMASVSAVYRLTTVSIALWHTHLLLLHMRENKFFKCVSSNFSHLGDGIHSCKLFPSGVFHTLQGGFHTRGGLQNSLVKLLNL